MYCVRKVKHNVIHKVATSSQKVQWEGNKKKEQGTYFTHKQFNKLIQIFIDFFV